MNFLKWLENLWNLRKIFDKYLPQLRELVTTVKRLQQQIAELKELKEELENGILLLKASKDKESEQATEEINVPSRSSSYYDSEGNGGWNVEINPGKK